MSQSVTISSQPRDNLTLKSNKRDTRLSSFNRVDEELDEVVGRYFLLLADGTSRLLLADGTSKLHLAYPVRAWLLG